MNETENIELHPLTEDDIRPLTEIMTRAFDHDTKIHLGEESGGPDGYNDGRFLIKWGLHSPTKPFKVLLNGTLIGGVIVWIREHGHNYLGTIFIDLPFQGRGIGTKIWRLIESEYPDTKTWMTDTPGFSTKNHYFYTHKLGFTIIRIDNTGKQKEYAYIFKKRMQ
jgi:hypothetical protein